MPKRKASEVVEEEEPLTSVSTPVKKKRKNAGKAPTNKKESRQVVPSNNNNNNNNNNKTTAPPVAPSTTTVTPAATFTSPQATPSSKTVSTVEPLEIADEIPPPPPASFVTPRHSKTTAEDPVSTPDSSLETPKPRAPPASIEKTPAKHTTKEQTATTTAANKDDENDKKSPKIVPAKTLPRQVADAVETHLVWILQVVQEQFSHIVNPRKFPSKLALLAAVLLLTIWSGGRRQGRTVPLAANHNSTNMSVHEHYAQDCPNHVDLPTPSGPPLYLSEIQQMVGQPRSKNEVLLEDDEYEQYCNELRRLAQLKPWQLMKDRFSLRAKTLGKQSQHQWSRFMAVAHQWVGDVNAVSTETELQEYSYLE